MEFGLNRAVLLCKVVELTVVSVLDVRPDVKRARWSSGYGVELATRWSQLASSIYKQWDG